MSDGRVFRTLNVLSDCNLEALRIGTDFASLQDFRLCGRELDFSVRIWALAWRLDGRVSRVSWGCERRRAADKIQVAAISVWSSG